MDSAGKEQIFAEIAVFCREKIIQCFWISEKKYSTKKGSDSSKDCKKIKKKEHPAILRDALFIEQNEKNFVQLHESNQEPSRSKHFSFGFVDRVEFHTCSKERVCYHERAPCTETIALHKTKARNSVQLQVGSALSMEPNFTLAQKSECVNTSERRVLKLSPYTKPKRNIGSRLSLV